MGFFLSGCIWGHQCSNAESVLPVRTCARGNQQLGRELFDAWRKETTLSVQIHSWDYLTSKYCLHSSLIFPCFPPSTLFPLPWESTARKVLDHSVLILPCEPAILQGQGGGRVACLYCSKIGLHYITLPFWPLPYMKPCCRSALCDRSCFWSPCFWELLRSKRTRQKRLLLVSLDEGEPHPGRTELLK